MLSHCRHIWDLLDPCERFEMFTIFSVFESSHLRAVWWVRGCMWKIFFLDLFCLHLFTVVRLASQPTPLKITLQKDSSAICTYPITFKCREEQWTMHLNGTQQLLTWWLSFYRAYCAKPCQHFMQDEPASSWSKYSNMFQVQVSFWYCFTVKGTTDVN